MPIKHTSLTSLAPRFGACDTAFRLPERSFIILKYVGKVPSLASCAKCQRKFLTPKTYSKEWTGAEEYLRGKFDLHQCPQEDEPKQTSTVH